MRGMKVGQTDQQEPDRLAPIRSIEVTFRHMLPRDTLVYFVRRCAQLRRLRGDALRACLQHLEQGGYHVALELQVGRRVVRATAMHAAALVAVWRCFEALGLPVWRA
jgi:hypothetical protein